MSGQHKRHRNLVWTMSMWIILINQLGSVLLCVVYTALIDVIYYTDNTTARGTNDFSIKFYVNNIKRTKTEIGICNNVMKPPPTVEFCNHYT